MATETKEEFEAGYIERSKITREFYDEHFTTLPCTRCDYEECTGWAAVGKGNEEDHNLFYA